MQRHATPAERALILSVVAAGANQMLVRRLELLEHCEASASASALG